MSDEAAFALAEAIGRLASAVTSLWAVPLLVATALLLLVITGERR